MTKTTQMCARLPPGRPANEFAPDGAGKCGPRRSSTCVDDAFLSSLCVHTSTKLLPLPIRYDREMLRPGSQQPERCLAELGCQNPSTTLTYRRDGPYL